AGPRAAAAVEGQRLQGLFERSPRRRLDAHVPVERRFQAAAFLDRLDDQRELAELEQVALLERPIPLADAVAVEVRPVGAAEVAQAPAALAQHNLGVLPADGGVVQPDLDRFVPPDAEPLRRLPDLALDPPGPAA